MAIQKQMPLLKLFPGCAVQGRLRAAAEACTVHHVVVHTASRSLELTVRFSTPQDEDVCERLSRALCRAYGLHSASLLRTAIPEDAPAVPVRFAPPEEPMPLPEEVSAPASAPLPEELPEDTPLFLRLAIKLGNRAQRTEQVIPIELAD